jgi:lipopolysaccharide transport system ATP-binding protein
MAAVTVTGLGKSYLLGEHTGYQLLSETLGRRFRTLGRRAARETLWALSDLSFEVDPGETFGIVGHNGAGKSTLLKLLSQITKPTTGEIRITGRVGALLEVGTGFHPELTGRENIYLNGAILGMPRAQINKKFDEIVEFAEIAPFIDTPVKRYSSGMYLRLGFSVAAHLEPEVLIIDEVLAVGDTAFQEKCIGRMESVANKGRTVLFVSHNLAAVRKLCSRSMLLSHGTKVAEGPTNEVLETYLSSLAGGAGVDLSQRTDRQGDGRFRFTEVLFRADGRVVDIPLSGQDLEVVLRYEIADGAAVAHPTVGIAIYTTLGAHLVQLHSETAGGLSALPPNGEITCRVPNLPLPAGRYRLNVFGASGGEVADWVSGATDMTVADGDFFGTGRTLTGEPTVLVPHSWEVHERSAAAAFSA